MATIIRTVTLNESQMAEYGSLKQAADKAQSAARYAQSVLWEFLYKHEPPIDRSREEWDAGSTQVCEDAAGNIVLVRLSLKKEETQR